MEDGFLETVIGVPTAEPTLAGYDLQRTVRFGRRARGDTQYRRGEVTFILELHPVGLVSIFLAGVSCSYLPPGGLDQ